MMIVIFAAVVLLLSIAIGTHPIPPRRYDAATCRSCAYELEGLAAGTPCPECGDPDPAMRMTPERRAWISNRVPMVLLAAALWIAGIAAAQAMTPWLVRLSYEIQFGAGRVTWWPRSTWYNTPAVPVILAGLVLPLLAGIRSPRRAAAAMVAVMLIALAIHVGSWTLTYWLFSRGYIDGW